VFVLEKNSKFASECGPSIPGAYLYDRWWIAVLNAIYEEDFLGFSYGFRPKRGQHDAMDALSVAISNTCYVRQSLGSATPLRLSFI